MKKVLKAKFFSGPTIAVARGLLGCFLCRKIGRRTIRLKISEVEAYDGPNDRASHASRGKTARNAPMFEEGGRWYVYFTYGMHWMLNIVTGPKDYPAAVLIRGAGEIRGPARLTRYLKVDKRLNNKRAAPENGLWIERGRRVPKREVWRAPRIGVAYAGPWAGKHYRFLVGNM